MNKLKEFLKEQQSVQINALLGMWGGLLLYFPLVLIPMAIYESITGRVFPLDLISEYSWEVIMMWAGASGAAFVSKSVGPRPPA